MPSYSLTAKQKQKFDALAKSQPTNARGGSDFRAEITDEDGDSITISLRGTVGDSWEENDHESIVSQLEASPEKDVVLHINSLGGAVFDGFGIANALISHQGTVTAIIEGVAFSAASFIAIAADKVVMHKASTYGIHRSLTLTHGNSLEHKATIEWLDAIDEILIDMYVEKTGKTPEEIVAILDGTVDGTIYTAKNAVKEGFADEVYEPKKKKTKKAAEPEEVVEVKDSVVRDFTALRAERRKSAMIQQAQRISDLVESLSP
jgi:ATP-dependent Clp protease, protease subunit